MKSASEAFKESFEKYLPYFIQLIVTILAIWYMHTYITEFCADGDFYNQKRQLFICDLIVVCASILWARMTYLQNKVMKKLEQLERKTEDK